MGPQNRQEHPRPPGVGWSILLLVIGGAVTIASSTARPLGVILLLVALAGLGAWWWNYRAHRSSWGPPGSGRH
jgi:hypothetical protein